MKRLLVFLVLVAALSPVLAQQDPNGEPPEQPAPQTPPAPSEPAPVPPSPAPVAPAAPAPAPAPMPMVLGQFVMKAAAAMKLQAPSGGFSPESAAWALSVKGIKVRADLGSQTTEADAVAVLTGLGYRIRTTTPSRLLSDERINLLIETFIRPDKS